MGTSNNEIKQLVEELQIVEKRLMDKSYALPFREQQAFKVLDRLRDGVLKDIATLQSGGDYEAVKRKYDPPKNEVVRDLIQEVRESNLEVPEAEVIVSEESKELSDSVNNEIEQFIGELTQLDTTVKARLDALNKRIDAMEARKIEVEDEDAIYGEQQYLVNLVDEEIPNDIAALQNSGDSYDEIKAKYEEPRLYEMMHDDEFGAEEAQEEELGKNIDPEISAELESTFNEAKATSNIEEDDIDFEVPETGDISGDEAETSQAEEEEDMQKVEELLSELSGSETPDAGKVMDDIINEMENSSVEEESTELKEQVQAAEEFANTMEFSDVDEDEAQENAGDESQKEFPDDPIGNFVAEMIEASERLGPEQQEIRERIQEDVEALVNARGEAQVQLFEELKEAYSHEDEAQEVDVEDNTDTVILDEIGAEQEGAEDESELDDPTARELKSLEDALVDYQDEEDVDANFEELEALKAALPDEEEAQEVEESQKESPEEKAQKPLLKMVDDLLNDPKNRGEEKAAYRQNLEGIKKNINANVFTTEADINKVVKKYDAIEAKRENEARATVVEESYSAPDLNKMKAPEEVKAFVDEMMEIRERLLQKQVDLMNDAELISQPEGVEAYNGLIHFQKDIEEDLMEITRAEGNDQKALLQEFEEKYIQDEVIGDILAEIRGEEEKAEQEVDEASDSGMEIADEVFVDVAFRKTLNESSEIDSEQDEELADPNFEELEALKEALSDYKDEEDEAREAEVQEFSEDDLKITKKQADVKLKNLNKLSGSQDEIKTKPKTNAEKDATRIVDGASDRLKVREGEVEYASDYEPAKRSFIERAGDFFNGIKHAMGNVGKSILKALGFDSKPKNVNPEDVIRFDSTNTSNNQEEEVQEEEQEQYHAREFDSNELKELQSKQQSDSTAQQTARRSWAKTTDNAQGHSAGNAERYSQAQEVKQSEIKSGPDRLTESQMEEVESQEIRPE